MPSYLVETYLARDDVAERTARDDRARTAAEAVAREGPGVRFEGSTHIPADELCFFAFEASSVEEVALVARLAGLDPLRIVETIGSQDVRTEV